MPMLPIEIAEVCHEANRALCKAMGDMSQVPWSEAPSWQRQSTMEGVGDILAWRVRGPASTHESWLKAKEAAGWKYGPVKDAEKKEHPDMVHYAALPHEAKRKDLLFFEIVQALRW